MGPSELALPKGRRLDRNNEVFPRGRLTSKGIQLFRDAEIEIIPVDFDTLSIIYLHPKGKDPGLYVFEQDPLYPESHEGSDPKEYIAIFIK